MVCVQLQIHQQSQVPQPDLDGTGNESEDEIDAALTDLQVTLEGSAVSATGDITRTPELHGYIRFFKYAVFIVAVVIIVIVRYKCEKLKSLKQCLTATRPTSHN